jgi:hypothetical protein
MQTCAYDIATGKNSIQSINENDWSTPWMNLSIGFKSLNLKLEWPVPVCKSIVQRREAYTLIQPRESPKVYGNNLGATALEHKTQVKIDRTVPKIFKDFSFHHCRSGLNIWTHNCFCNDAMSSQPYPWSWVSITSCQTPMLYGLVFCWCRKRRVTTTAKLLQQAKLASLRWLGSILLTQYSRYAF